MLGWNSAPKLGAEVKNTRLQNFFSPGPERSPQRENPEKCLRSKVAKSFSGSLAHVAKKKKTSLLLWSVFPKTSARISATSNDMLGFENGAKERIA